MQHGSKPFTGTAGRCSVGSTEGMLEVQGARNLSRTTTLRTENDFEDATADNPYNELGFGFTAYFGMLRTFICIFVVFTIIMTPLLVIYGTTDGLVVPSNSKTAKARYSLGNLGFSGSSCIS